MTGVYRCPATGHQVKVVSRLIEIEDVEFKRLIRLLCVACGQSHFIISGHNRPTKAEVQLGGGEGR